MKRKHVGGLIGLLVAGAILLCAGVVHAVTLSWDTPTTYTDNTLIPPDVLTTAFIRVYIADSAEGPWTRFPNSNYTPGWPTTDHVFDALNPAIEGKWYTLAFVVFDAAGNKISSDLAPGVQHLVVAPTPEPEPTPVWKKPTPPGRLRWTK